MAELSNVSKQLSFWGVQRERKVKGIFQLLDELALWWLNTQKGQISQKKAGHQGSSL